MTISIYGEDHMFDVWEDGGVAYVEYQESLVPRGEIRVSDPDEIVYRELMQSDEMDAFMDEMGCNKVRRAEPVA